MQIFLVLIMLLNAKLSQSYRKALEGFIVGGSYTSINKYPHSAFLDIRCKGIWICGSSILNQKILLTAAHCLVDCNFNLEGDVVYAMAGHEHLNKITIKRKVNHFILHENYDTENLINDIGLASLEKPLPLTPSTKRIIIPLQFPNVKVCSVAGWGTTNEETGETSLMLKSVTQKIRSSNVCHLITASQPGMFCAGSLKESEEYPSTGDSGSALVTEDGLEVGLLSYRMVNVPTIVAYTNTTYYYSWIEYHANLLFCT